MENVPYCFYHTTALNFFAAFQSVSSLLILIKELFLLCDTPQKRIHAKFWFASQRLPIQHLANLNYLEAETAQNTSDVVRFPNPLDIGDPVWCRSGHSANIDICPRILDHKLFINHILKTRINVKSACSNKVTNQILNRPPMFSESRVFVFLSVFSNSPYAARRDVSHCWCLYFANGNLLLRSFLAAALVPFLLKVSTEPGNKAPLWFPSQ